MIKTQAIETLEALDRATAMRDMEQREVIKSIQTAWLKTPPDQAQRIARALRPLKKIAPQMGDSGGIELAAKLGMFLRSRGL